MSMRPLFMRFERYEFRDGQSIGMNDDLMQHLIDWVDLGRPMGHFLTALVENDLAEAVSRADEHSLRVLPALVGWLYNEAPSECWGGKEKARLWSEHRGLSGIDARAGMVEAKRIHNFRRANQVMWALEYLIDECYWPENEEEEEEHHNPDLLNLEETKEFLAFLRSIS